MRWFFKFPCMPFPCGPTLDHATEEHAREALRALFNRELPEGTKVYPATEKQVSAVSTLMKGLV